MVYSLSELRALALDFTRHGVILTDTNQHQNVILDVNPAFEVMSGYTRNEIIGKNCRFLQGKDTSPDTIKTLRNTIESESSIRVTIKNYRKNGEAFWNELTVSPVHRDGVLVAYVGVQEDVTVEYLAKELSKKEFVDLENVNVELNRMANQRKSLDQRIEKLLKQSHL